MGRSLLRNSAVGGRVGVEHQTITLALNTAGNLDGLGDEVEILFATWSPMTESLGIEPAWTSIEIWTAASIGCCGEGGSSRTSESLQGCRVAAWQPVEHFAIAGVVAGLGLESKG